MSAPDKSQPIAAIWGHEPMREGEYPDGFVVGTRCATADGIGLVDRGVVTSIAYREEYLGDHSDAWFDVFVGADRVSTMGARAVALIQYLPGEPS